jgi:leader peptidase (prepilin peptidase)/N-methyltransferase
MMQTALLACLAICVNCGYAVAGLAAANRYRIEVSLHRGTGMTIIAAGTALEIASLMFHAHFVSEPVLVIAFGAVVVAAACDAACGYVFDAITLPCLAALSIWYMLSQSIPAFALGVAACGGSLALLYAVTLGRGLGLGDVKLACCIGGAAGAANGISALGVAFVLGGVYAVYLLATKRAQRGDELRFAPYLAAGMAAVVLHGAFL